MDILTQVIVSAEHPAPAPHHFDLDDPLTECPLCRAVSSPPGWEERLAEALRRF